MLGLIRQPILVPLLPLIFLLERAQAFGFEELNQLSCGGIIEINLRGAAGSCKRKGLRIDRLRGAGCQVLTASASVCFSSSGSGVMICTGISGGSSDSSR